MGLLGALAGYIALALTSTLVQEVWLGGVSYRDSGRIVLLLAGVFTPLCAFVGGLVGALVAGQSRWLGFFGRPGPGRTSIPDNPPDISDRVHFPHDGCAVLAAPTRASRAFPPPRAALPHPVRRPVAAAPSRALAVSAGSREATSRSA